MHLPKLETETEVGLLGRGAWGQRADLLLAQLCRGCPRLGWATRRRDGTVLVHITKYGQSASADNTG